MSLDTNFGNALTKFTAVSSPATTDMTESAEEEDTATSDKADISSAEDDNDDDLTSSEDEDDDTSSAVNDDFTSGENCGDDISSLEPDNDSISTTPALNVEPTSNNITNLRPNNERPNISLELVKDSTVASKLPDFLAQMRAANQELEEEKSAGTLANRRIEIDESECTAKDEQHIELNLGLGVLEEMNYEADTTIESDYSNDESDSDVMEILLARKRKRGLDGDDEAAPKKAKIQEV